MVFHKLKINVFIMQVENAVICTSKLNDRVDSEYSEIKELFSFKMK